ncbi:hypothetical protein FJ364_01940 [Candidatus Dependentiae bacterium]|nr:hypothetical protein [Candidatus Dependentiae bacterium]
MNKLIALVAVIGFSVVANVESADHRMTRSQARQDETHPVTRANKAREDAKKSGTAMTEDEINQAIDKESKAAANNEASLFNKACAYAKKNPVLVGGVTGTAVVAVIVAADLARGDKSFFRKLFSKKAQQERIAINQ